MYWLTFKANNFEPNDFECITGKGGLFLFKNKNKKLYVVDFPAEVCVELKGWTTEQAKSELTEQENKYLFQCRDDLYTAAIEVHLDRYNQSFYADNSSEKVG